MLVSKILQNLANGVKFREDYLSTMNVTFLEEKIPIITSFFDHISVSLYSLLLSIHQLTLMLSKYRRTAPVAEPSSPSAARSSRRSFPISFS